MIKIEKTEVYGWEAAIRGMRNPMNSWEKSDTGWVDAFTIPDKYWLEYDSESGTAKVIGDNDYDLMKRLAQAGSVHAKYRRMITVTVDITAPLYWWKEFDTYKVGTVANSCSTMHKIHAKELTLDDFSCERLFDGVDRVEGESDMEYWENPTGVLEYVIRVMNHYRLKFLDTNDKRYWDQMIQLLPTSFNQKRTVQMNYEVLVGMYRDRKNHKLDEWHTLCDWIRSLPYSEIITG